METCFHHGISVDIYFPIRRDDRVYRFDALFKSAHSNLKTGLSAILISGMILSPLISFAPVAQWIISTPPSMTLPFSNPVPFFFSHPGKNLQN